MSPLETCLVCSLPWDVEWNDASGEASCVQCGTPYQVLAPHAPVVTAFAEDLAVLRQYWHETARHNGLGNFLSAPRYPENRSDFYAWVRERYPELSRRDEEW